MSKCQLCRSGGDCFEWCRELKKIDSLKSELQAVKDQLREVVEYKTMWQGIAGKANLKELVKKAEMADEAVKILGSFDEYRSASDRGETSKTKWHTFERILYDCARQFLTKHQLSSEEGR